MKTLRFAMMALALTVLSAALSSCDKDEFLTVENTAGNLESQIGNLKNVSTLKISGLLNGNDIYYLREIMSSTSYDVSALDLSDASIVDGGMSYVTIFGTKYYTTKDEIGDYMFYECNKLKNIILPNDVTRIGTSAFSRCFLKKITIPDNVTEIEGEAFADCEHLTDVIIGKNVILIDAQAFYECRSLINVVIGNRVTSIDDAFPYCRSLTEINIPDSVTSMSGAFSSCYSLTNVKIGNGVTSIGPSTFSACESLKGIDIPDSVTEIGRSAFSGCGSLTEIAIPDGVTSIGTRAFYRCTNLYTLIIGGGVTTIGDYAFDGNDRLYEIYCYASTPPNIGSETFTKPTFLYVPKGSLEAYETAWGDYFTNISEMD